MSALQRESGFPMVEPGDGEVLGAVAFAAIPVQELIFMRLVRVMARLAVTPPPGVLQEIVVEPFQLKDGGLMT